MTADRVPPAGGEGGPYTVEPINEPCESCGHRNAGWYAVMEGGEARSTHATHDEAEAEAYELNRAFLLGCSRTEAAFAAERRQLNEQLADLRKQLEDIAAVGL